MSNSVENPSSQKIRDQRSRWSIIKASLGEESLDLGTTGSTPEQRLGMVWPLTIQAWAFKGVDVAESRLPRHLMRIERRARAVGRTKDLADAEELESSANDNLSQSS